MAMVLWDVDINIALREALAPVVPVLNQVTHLGDGAVLIAMAVWIYWFGGAETRRERAFVIAVGVAAFALATGIKGIVGLPRPDLAFAPGGYPGYSFPSAHALGAAAFYGALAVTIKRGSRLLRYSIAGIVIFLVSLSRLTLGVHYLGDVLVGTLLGLLLVWIGHRWRHEGQFRPGLLFVLATAIALVTVALGSRVWASLVIGAGVGGAIGWYWVKDRPITESGAAILVTGLVAFIGLAIAAAIPLTVGTPVPGAPDPVLFVAETIAYLLVVAFVMGLPAIATSVEDHPRVRWLQRVLPFRRRRVQFDAIGEEIEPTDG
jgi:membrane-associated phospholipid phosphatase